jgi:hypothetical protein
MTHLAIFIPGKDVPSIVIKETANEKADEDQLFLGQKSLPSAG